MDTAQEALFKAMLNEGWFIASDGDVESPTGYFGYVANRENELAEIREAFSDTLDAYGPVADEDLIGAWIASIASTGVISIRSMPADVVAKQWYEDTLSDYLAWLEA
jgi:hypothetical protein